MGDIFAQPVAPRLRGIGAGYGSGSIASNMCRDESLDIRSAVPNAAADSDEWAATAVSPFAVERPQTATQKFCCFRRREKGIDCGLACQCQTEPGVARLFMTWIIFLKCPNQPLSTFRSVHAVD